jgi:hypothetical protein
MSMTKWFGEPWPSAELRAPVCEDDADRVPPPPPGEECILCGRGFKPDAQGVVMPHMTASDIMPGMFITEIHYSHIDCLIGNVTGEGSFALG